MSSMRNAVQRRNHKERSQPQERAKWGLLEKRKDYNLRAKDHNLKKRKLKALQTKAAERNEDEFYFGMMRNQTQGGRKIAVRAEENSGGSGKSLSMEVVKLMKTQDTAYLRTILQSARRLRERLEQEVVLLEQGASTNPRPSHTKTTFDDSGEALIDATNATSEEEDNMDLDALMRFHEENGDAGEDADSSDKDEEVSPQEKAIKRKKRHHVNVKRRQLEAILKREQSLTVALREVEDQRARMNGTAGGVNKAGVKYRPRERRR